MNIEYTATAIHVIDENCLGTMSVGGDEASCICPLLKDERAFGVIRFT